jgi:hypothetical protein
MESRQTIICLFLRDQCKSRQTVKCSYCIINAKFVNFSFILGDLKTVGNGIRCMKNKSLPESIISGYTIHRHRGLDNRTGFIRLNEYITGTRIFLLSINKY